MSNNAPEFLSAVPVLPALAINEAIAFYEQRLGFTTEFKYDDYAGLSRGGIQIHLWLCDDRSIAENSGCRVNVKHIENLYEEYQVQQIIHPQGSLVTKPWGLKEFIVLDLSGNAITFAQLK